MHRVGRETVLTLMLDRAKARRAIVEVLRGQSPGAVELFKGGPFGEIEESDRTFWLELFARLTILDLAKQNRRLRELEPRYGLAMVGPLTWSLDESMGFDEWSEAVDTLKWDSRWAASRASREFRSNMVVERPLVPCVDGWHATGVIAIEDSIPWYVDQYLTHGYPSEEHQASPSTRQRAVATRFEASVVEAARRLGMVAGEVDVSGSWQVGAEIRLCKSGPPGQVDALAMAPDETVGLVIECKVLQIPTSRSAMRNAVAKLGDQDAEGIHRKLAGKLEWAKRTFPETSWTAIVLTDRPHPMCFARKGDHPIVEFRELISALEGSSPLRGVGVPGFLETSEWRRLAFAPNPQEM